MLHFVVIFPAPRLNVEVSRTGITPTLRQGCQVGKLGVGESIADKRNISTDNNILTRLLFTKDGLNAYPIVDKMGLWLNFKYTVGQITFTPEYNI